MSKSAVSNVGPPLDEDTKLVMKNGEKTDEETDESSCDASSDDVFSCERDSGSVHLLDGTIIPASDLEELSNVELIMETKMKDVPPGSASHCVRSMYGNPLSVEEVAHRMPPGDGGLTYHARLISDDKSVQAEMIKKKIVPTKVFEENGSIQPRRGPNPVALVNDFMSSLVRVDASKRTRWIFSGVLNGWPGLTHLEVTSISCRKRVPFFFQPQLVRIWCAERHGVEGIPPHIHKNLLQQTLDVRVTLRAPPHTRNGYTKDSPGLLFWFEANCSVPRLLHGVNIVKHFQDVRMAGGNVPLCTQAHLFVHRYASGNRKENPKDKVTYHSGVLLEWDHGKYCTVVEVGLYNGLGGYRGKCNWYDDMHETLPSLYVAMPPEMIVPWNTKQAEIRCLDVAARNLEEFKDYVKKYTGQMHRFVDPRFTHSHRVRMTFRSQEHIAQYLLNYIGRDPSYSEMNRNCQTFAADLYGFLVGKKGIEPFHPLNRMDYTNRAHLFMYDFDMYE